MVSLDEPFQLILDDRKYLLTLGMFCVSLEVLRFWVAKNVLLCLQ